MFTIPSHGWFIIVLPTIVIVSQSSFFSLCFHMFHAFNRNSASNDTSRNSLDYRRVTVTQIHGVIVLDLDRQFTLRAWCFELFLCLAFQIGFVWKWKFPSGFSRFHHHRASERHQPSAAVGEARPVSSTLDQRPAAQSYAY